MIVELVIILPGPCALMTNISWELLAIVDGGIGRDCIIDTVSPDCTISNHCDWSVI